MKIGCDIHGVIDLYPDLFREWSRKWIEQGHDISIITGQEWEKVKHKVDDAGVVYTAHFSIVDYHLSIGTSMTQDSKNTWWMSEKLWIRSKGDYIHRMNIDIHFDDNNEYAQYIPDFCTLILVPPKGFDKFHRFMSNSPNLVHNGLTGSLLAP